MDTSANIVNSNGVNVEILISIHQVFQIFAAYTNIIE